MRNDNKFGNPLIILYIKNLTLGKISKGVMDNNIDDFVIIKNFNIHYAYKTLIFL